MNIANTRTGLGQGANGHRTSHVWLVSAANARPGPDADVVFSFYGGGVQGFRCLSRRAIRFFVEVQLAGKEKASSGPH